MRKMVVRIESLEIINFKNVKHGILEFTNNRKAFKSSVLGLYGQNGSGKTALIDALSLLKLVLSGKSVPAYFADYINVDALFATLKFNLKVKNKETLAEYIVNYEFSIRKDIDETTQNINQEDLVDEKYKATIFDEVLSYSFADETTKIKMGPIVDTRTDEIFSWELLNIFRQNCKEQRHLDLFEALIWFGNYELFIINTSNSGLISMNALPLVFRYEDRVKHKASFGSLMIELNKPSLVPQDALEVVKKVIANMNVVLTQIIPGLTISVKDLGTELLKNGKVGSKIQLMSHKNSKEIPLQYESEGIKKTGKVIHVVSKRTNQEESN